MKELINKFRRLFYKKCPVCNEKKQWFYYTWEFPMSKQCMQYPEVCQECALNNKES